MPCQLSKIFFSSVTNHKGIMIQKYSDKSEPSKNGVLHYDIQRLYFVEECIFDNLKFLFILSLFSSFVLLKRHNICFSEKQMLCQT